MLTKPVRSRSADDQGDLAGARLFERIDAIAVGSVELRLVSLNCVRSAADAPSAVGIRCEVDSGTLRRCSNRVLVASEQAPDNSGLPGAKGLTQPYGIEP